jgi:hypothetical protein
MGLNNSDLVMVWCNDGGEMNKPVGECKAVCACVCVCAHVCMHACMHACARARVRVCVCLCLCVPEGADASIASRCIIIGAASKQQQNSL